MIRFSLATLFSLVLWAALACAALVYASPLIQQIAVTAAVLILGLAVLVAFGSRGRARAAAAGFAFTGWAYLLLANVGALNLQQQLLTGNVNGWLYTTLHPPPDLTPGNHVLVLNDDVLALTAADYEVDKPELSSARLDFAAVDPALTERIGAYELAYRLQTQVGDGSRLNVNTPAPRVSTSTFQSIAHAIWALLLGLLAAAVATAIHARAHRAATKLQEVQ